jgi:hypothetical protein
VDFLGEQGVVTSRKRQSFFGIVAAFFCVNPVRRFAIASHRIGSKNVQVIFSLQKIRKIWSEA